MKSQKKTESERNYVTVILFTIVIVIIILDLTLFGHKI